MELNWVGSNEAFVDKLEVKTIEHVQLGRFGGNSSVGQYKNEDGCLVWVNKILDWEFVLLMDAHNTAESAELILRAVEQEKFVWKNIFALPTNECFIKLEEAVLTLFQRKSFIEECRKITGETACLIVLRKDHYLWWFSVGDCVLYHFHHELMAFGQYQLNQRNFYEWIGEVNTFDSPVPCYSTGRKELRNGENRIFLTTDGLLECPNTKFDQPIDIYLHMKSSESEEEKIRNMLEDIRIKGVRDSTTVISWVLHIEAESTQPSDK
jgi:serine/threonine protein phosphatase PrpC